MYDWSVRAAVRGGSSPQTSSTRRDVDTAVPADRARAASSAWHLAGPTWTGVPSPVTAPTPPSRRIRTAQQSHIRDTAGTQHEPDRVGV